MRVFLPVSFVPTSFRTVLPEPCTADPNMGVSVARIVGKNQLHHVRATTYVSTLSSTSVFHFLILSTLPNAPTLQISST